MQSQQKSIGLIALLLTFFINTTFAQLILPPVDATTTTGNLILGATTPADHGDPNAARINYRLDVNGGNVTDGSQSAIYAKTLASGNNAVGETYGAIGSATNWHAGGSFSGATGVARNITLLRTNYNDKTASVTGGNFVAHVNDPIALPNTGQYLINGVRGVLDGTINTYPKSGIIAAIYGQDRIKGTGTWAGYFDGRSYFSGRVGIGTLDPKVKTHIVAEGEGGLCVETIHPKDSWAYNSIFKINDDLTKAISVFDTRTNEEIFLVYGKGSTHVKSLFAEEITVKLTAMQPWPDYVFHSDYQLPSLTEVAQHIEEKGHLPNTPSAEEVAKNGIDLGEITINQQEKIEELFLHLIEMKKEIKQLKAENDALKQNR